MFSDKKDFFSVFGCIPENAPKNIYSAVRKIKQKGRGVRRAFFENGLRKNLA
jgi:hypothetical protein